MRILKKMFGSMKFRWLLASSLSVLVLVLVFPTLVVHASDPTGASLGTAADVTSKIAGQPTLEEVAIQVGHNKISINFVWTLLTGFLVFFMQAGFAMVETGFTRAKNAAHTMAMNMVIYVLGVLGFWVCGFAFMFGGVGPLATLGGENILNHAITMSLFGKTVTVLGWKGFFLTGESYAPAIFTMFLFQTVFMDATATIPTGAMAERWRFLPFVIYGLLVPTIMYPIYGCWVWGGGWLATLGSNFGLGHGHVDFAGSSVVHMSGGVIALVGAKLIGPRVGKYSKDGKPHAMPGHHIPMAVLGTMVLCFGWFGFNPGSTLSGVDLRYSIVAVNTMLASVAGGMTAMIYMWKVYGKPDISMTCNGILAGLVAITAPCAFTNAVNSVIIGAVAGVLVCVVAFFVERTLKIDDPVGAVAVHGANGLWGCLALGLFSDGAYGDGWNGVAGPVKGLFYGDTGQFIAQCIGVLTNFIFFSVMAFIVFKVIDKFTPLRSSDEDQVRGLDVPEIGVEAYPEFKPE